MFKILLNYSTNIQIHSAHEIKWFQCFCKLDQRLQKSSKFKFKFKFEKSKKKLNYKVFLKQKKEERKIARD